MLVNMMTEEVQVWDTKQALVGVDDNPMRGESRKYRSQVIKVLFWGGTCNEDIVDVGVGSRDSMEDLVHETLQHLDDLRTVFSRLASHGIVINPNKCLFGVPHLDWNVGHVSGSMTMVIVMLLLLLEGVIGFPKISKVGPLGCKALCRLGKSRADVPTHQEFSW